MALIGLSRNPSKFSRNIYKELTDKGYQILPVTPHAEEIKEITCFKAISELPDEIDRALVVTPKSETEKTVKELAEIGIKKVWIQQMAETDEALKIAEENEMEVIHKKCILMFSEPVKSIHSFHRFFVKMFGKYPK